MVRTAELKLAKTRSIHLKQTQTWRGLFTENKWVLAGVPKALVVGGTDNDLFELQRLRLGGISRIQWTPAIPATLGNEQIGWISEVAGSQGYLINPAT